MTKNKFRLLLIFILGALLLAFSNYYLQESRVGQIKEGEFAQVALENYVSHMLNEKNVQNFGFKNMKEAENARVGESVSVYYIHLDALKEYNPDIPVRKILSDPSKLFFFVLVDKEVRTKIEIIQIDGEWVAGEFGGIDSVQYIEKAHRELPALLKRFSISETKPPVLVQVPVLHATLLYIEADDGSGYFTNVTMLPARYGLKSGQLYRAERILTLFADDAEKIEEDLIY